MLEQLAIDFSPREVGRAGADACAGKAERVSDFDTANARVFVLGYLAKHGNSSGEGTSWTRPKARAGWT